MTTRKDKILRHARLKDNPDLYIPKEFDRVDLDLENLYENDKVMGETINELHTKTAKNIADLESNLTDKINNVELLKPEDGKTPTSEELVALIKPLIPAPKKGDKGDTTIVEKVIERIEDGTNKSMGTAILVGGTVTVSNTRVTANSRIFLTNEAVGGTIGIISVGTKTAGTSFVINSSNVLDTSTVAWLIVEPN